MGKHAMGKVHCNMLISMKCNRQISCQHFSSAAAHVSEGQQPDKARCLRVCAYQGCRAVRGFQGVQILQGCQGCLGLQAVPGLLRKKDITHGMTTSRSQVSEIPSWVCRQDAKQQ